MKDQSLPVSEMLRPGEASRLPGRRWLACLPGGAGRRVDNSTKKRRRAEGVNN